MLITQGSHNMETNQSSQEHFNRELSFLIKKEWRRGEITQDLYYGATGFKAICISICFWVKYL